jgi:hypothetical protein
MVGTVAGRLSGFDKTRVITEIDLWLLEWASNFVPCCRIHHAGKSGIVRRRGAVKAYADAHIGQTRKDKAFANYGGKG